MDGRINEYIDGWISEGMLDEGMEDRIYGWLKVWVEG